MKKLKDFVLIRINGLLGERLLIWASLIKLLVKRINSKFRNNKTETANGYPYVDLGLPSGLKWAKCNVGAEKETDYGYYFMWGDIEDKSDDECSWESYKYCNWSYDTLTKYNTFPLFGEKPDDKTKLDSEDDAARVYMGGDWRMPTQTEIQELLENTENEWVEDFNGSGVNGRKFSSKINGNSIFIPAAGICRDGSVDYVGSSGGIWSSSLKDDYPNLAWYLYFNSGDCYIYGSRRCIGRSVRGVMD